MYTSTSFQLSMVITSVPKIAPLSCLIMNSSASETRLLAQGSGKYGRYDRVCPLTSNNYLEMQYHVPKTLNSTNPFANMSSDAVICYCNKVLFL